MTSAKRKFLIDCDVGTDDAQAILMALAHEEDIEVLAITTVFGNTTLEDTSRNALRVLKLCEKEKQIPVFKGCDKSLIGQIGIVNGFHGMDGLGDVPALEPVSTDLLQRDHAVTALNNLVNEHKGEATLVALGPLTNVAMAIRMDPLFGSKLKDCYIMGGSVGKGNITSNAEFNFYFDPEAAFVVLNQLGCSIVLADLQVCEENSFSWEWYEKLCATPTKKAKFVKSVDGVTVMKLKDRGRKTYGSWDQLAMAVAIDNKVAMETENVYASVELTGQLTRGQMVVDWHKKIGKDANIHLLTKVDKESYGQLVLDGVQK